MLRKRKHRKPIKIKVYNHTANKLRHNQYMKRGYFHNPKKRGE